MDSSEEKQFSQSYSEIDIINDYIQSDFPHKNISECKKTEKDGFKDNEVQEKLEVNLETWNTKNNLVVIRDHQEITPMVGESPNSQQTTENNRFPLDILLNRYSLYCPLTKHGSQADILQDKNKDIQAKKSDSQVRSSSVNSEVNDSTSSQSQRNNIKVIKSQSSEKSSPFEKEEIKNLASQSSDMTIPLEFTTLQNSETENNFKTSESKDLQGDQKNNREISGGLVNIQQEIKPIDNLNTSINQGSENNLNPSKKKSNLLINHNPAVNILPEQRQKRRFKPVLYDDSSRLNINLDDLKIRRMKRQVNSNVHDLGDLSIIQPVSVPVEQTISNALAISEADKFPTAYDLDSNLLNVIKKVDTPHDTHSEFKRTYLCNDREDAIAIENAKDYEDIRSRNLYGKLVYRENSELETYNFVELRDSRLICYNSERESYLDLPDGVGSFRSYEDSGKCYREMFTVDIKKARMYVSTIHEEKSTFQQWLWCWSRVHLDSLVDIIEKNIYKIVECEGKYHLYLDKQENYNYLELANLEFVIYYRGRYHTFRSNSMIDFLKWASAIQVRNSSE